LIADEPKKKEDSHEKDFPHGRISISRVDVSADMQRALLEEEGVEFDAGSRVDMRRFGWRGMDSVEQLALLDEGEQGES